MYKQSGGTEPMEGEPIGIFRFGTAEPEHEQAEHVAAEVA